MPNYTKPSIVVFRPVQVREGSPKLNILKSNVTHTDIFGKMYEMIANKVIECV